MKKLSLLILGVALFLTVTLPAHAQSGCTNSPENPTLVLALVGSGAALFASARSKIKARRSSVQK